MISLPYDNHYRIYEFVDFHISSVWALIPPGHRDIPIMLSCLSVRSDMWDRYNDQMPIVDQSTFYAIDDRSLECDMECEMCVYHQDIQDSGNVIYFPHTKYKIKINQYLISK